FRPETAMQSRRRMTPRESRFAPFGAAVLVASGLLLGGCAGMSGPDPAGKPAPLASINPARAAAVTEMRAEASAGDRMPFPDAYQSEQAARLASREEPRSVEGVRAIEAELADIADRRAKTTDAREIASLDARAKELRRLALAS